MGSKGSGQTIGYKYFMSLHMGLCRGPIDEIVQINAGDVRAWPVPDGDPNGVGGLMTTAEGPNGTGVNQYEDGTYTAAPGSAINTIRTSGDYSINAPELFGGEKKEGGISGALRAMMGSATQIVPGYIKSLMGGRVPDFRGVVTLFFDGMLCALNPYPKKWEFRVRRTLNGWDGDVWQPSLCTIWMRGDTIKAMNGAHIIYECITNRDWGRGMSRDSLKDEDWLETATTLYNEGFGLCLRYNRQSELSTFIQDVVDHIGGSIYPDRATGRLSLSLLRGDYDIDSIPLFTYDTGLIALEDAETASQDDIKNEVIVKWTDPIGKEERSARVQNLASRQATGAPNSVTTSYAGVPTVEMALRLAQRDVKASANSLKRYKVVLDRRAWRIVPGKVFRISVPDRNIFNAVLRAGKVTEQGGTDGKITVEAVLDVFGLPSASFISNQGSEWTPPDRNAQVATVRTAREATYAELVRTLDPANLQILAPTAGTVATIAGKPSALSQGYEIASRATGETTDTIGAGAFAPYVVTVGEVSPYQEIVPFNDGFDLGLAEIGDMVQMGDEICRLDDIVVDTVNGGGNLVLARGCVDTIPQTHPAGTNVFLVGDEMGGDGREFASGENVSVKILPFTSTNKLPTDLAPTDVVNIAGRQGRPYPPGNLLVDGLPFADPGALGTNVVLTWAHRDRIIQQDQLIEHEAASIGPEPGTTYTVRVYVEDTAIPVGAVTGISGTTFTYTSTMAAADGAGDTIWFELESVRAGFTSFFRYRFAVGFEPSGYGVSGYGDNYGG